MFRLLRGSCKLASQLKVPQQDFLRSLSLSHRLYLKEIRETQVGDTLYIEGVNVESPRKDFLLKTENDKGSCPLCAAGLLVKHTDVLIIKQFVDDFGKLLPRRITGLCRWQHRRLQYVLEMAIRAGLVSALLPPDEPIPEYQQGWRCFNTYYDEELIPPSKSEYRMERNKKYSAAYEMAKAERDAHERLLKSRQTRIQLNKK